MAESDFRIHADKFVQEIGLVCGSVKPTFILLGNMVVEFFERFTDGKFGDKASPSHYSVRGTTDEWLEESRQLLSSNFRNRE